MCISISCAKETIGSALILFLQSGSCFLRGSMSAVSSCVSRKERCWMLEHWFLVNQMRNCTIHWRHKSPLAHESHAVVRFDCLLAAIRTKITIIRITTTVKISYHELICILSVSILVPWIFWLKTDNRVVSSKAKVRNWNSKSLLSLLFVPIT